MSVADVEAANARFYRAFETRTENILSELQDRISVTSVLATNPFERDGDGWRMIHHHASHVFAPAGPPPDTMTA